MTLGYLLEEIRLRLGSVPELKEKRFDNSMVSDVELVHYLNIAVFRSFLETSSIPHVWDFWAEQDDLAGITLTKGKINEVSNEILDKYYTLDGVKIGDRQIEKVTYKDLVIYGMMDIFRSYTVFSMSGNILYIMIGSDYEGALSPIYVAGHRKPIKMVKPDDKADYPETIHEAVMKYTIYNVMVFCGFGQQADEYIQDKENKNDGETGG